MLGLSWLNPFGSTSNEPVEAATKVTSSRSAQLKQRFGQMTQAHSCELQEWMNEIIDENFQLKDRLDEVEGELKMWRAGRKEDVEEIAKLRAQVRQLARSDTVSSPLLRRQS